MKFFSSRGFTLIELMVVVGIIVVLATLAMTSYTSANKKARDSRRMADLEQIRSAMELYRTDEGTYPDTTNNNGQNMGHEYFGNLSFSDPLGNDYQWVESENYSYELCAPWESSNDPPRSCDSACSFQGFSDVFCVTNP